MGYYVNRVLLLSLELGLVLGAHAQSSYYGRSYYNPIVPQTASYYHRSSPFSSLSYSSDLLSEPSNRKEFSKPYSKKIPIRSFGSEEEDFSNERFSSAEFSNESHGFNSKESDEYTIGTQLRVQHPSAPTRKPSSTVHAPHSKHAKYTSVSPYKTSSFSENNQEELADLKPLPKKHAQKYTQIFEPANSYKTNSYSTVHIEEFPELKPQPKKHAQKFTQIFEPASSYKSSSHSEELPEPKSAPKKHAQKYSQLYEPDPFHLVAPPKSTAPSAFASHGYNVYEPEEEEYEVTPPSHKVKANTRDRYKGVASKKQIEKYLEDQQKMLDEALKMQLLNNPKFQHLLKTKENEHFEELEYEHKLSPPLSPYRSNFNENQNFKPNRSRRRPQGLPKVKPTIGARPKRKYRSAILIDI